MGCGLVFLYVCQREGYVCGCSGVGIVKEELNSVGPGMPVVGVSVTRAVVGVSVPKAVAGVPVPAAVMGITVPAAFVGSNQDCLVIGLNSVGRSGCRMVILFGDSSSGGLALVLSGQLVVVVVLW